MNKLPLVGAMTGIEAAAVLAWFYTVIGSGTVYATTAVLGGLFLAIGLFVEDWLVLSDANRPSMPLSLGLAITEVVVWTQWANIVVAGMWSAEGIGPAFVVLSVLLVLQHSVEHAIVDGKRPFDPQLLVSSSVEAMAATLLWVLTTRGEPIWGAIALVTVLGIEHAIRVYS